MYSPYDLGARSPSSYYGTGGAVRSVATVLELPAESFGERTEGAQAD